jgi:hypothetical protein
VRRGREGEKRKKRKKTSSLAAKTNQRSHQETYPWKKPKDGLRAYQIKVAVNVMCCFQIDS